MYEDEKRNRTSRIMFAAGIVATLAYFAGRRAGSRATWKQFEKGWLVTGASQVTTKGGERLKVEFQNGAYQFLQPK